MYSRHIARFCATPGKSTKKTPSKRSARVNADGSVLMSLLVQLPDWVYPVVVDLASGQLTFDDFGGRWGERCHLDQFLQAYAVERARAEARRRGHSVAEQTLPDGAIKLTIQVQGGDAW